MRHRMRSRRRPPWHAEARRAAGAFCVALLLAGPALVTAARVGRPKAAALPGLIVKRDAGWCAEQVTGCSVCTEERPAPAHDAQFPGLTAGPDEPVSIVRCTHCQLPYVLNKENQNCDCARGAGTAFANGTLISAEPFSGSGPAGAPANRSSTGPWSDSLPFPAPGSATVVEAGSTSTSASTTAMFQDVSASAAGSSDAADAPLSAQQLRRRMQAYLRAQGYSVSMRNNGGVILVGRVEPLLFSEAVTAGGSAGSSSSSSRSSGGLKSQQQQQQGEPAGVTEQPQPLACMACKHGTTSHGGLLGGSFCSPCAKGEQPDANGGCSKPLRRR